MNRINIQSLVFVLGLVSCGGVSASAMRDCTVTCETIHKCEEALKDQLGSSKELSTLRASILDIMAPMQGHLKGLKEKHAQGFFSSFFVESKKRAINSDLYTCAFYTPFKARLKDFFKDLRFNENLLKYAGDYVWVECDDKKNPIWALGELPFDNMKALVKSSALAPVRWAEVSQFQSTFVTGKESLSDYIDAKAKEGFEAIIALDRQDDSKFLVRIQDRGRDRY